MSKKVIEIYQSGKGFKAISKAFYKCRKHGTVENLPRSGRQTKITPRAQRQLIQEVTKDPTTTSKELQASLASVKKTKWWKLKKEECCEEFRQKLRQALGGQVVLPDDWETTAEVIRETGRKVLGVSSGRRKEDKETW
ncbi:hypothetical protein QTP86_000947 [Hemibagrus guttatus]|nr:hypothetical protein QTP86_000947 [Hemibagrus guttatus]